MHLDSCGSIQTHLDSCELTGLKRIQLDSLGPHLDSLGFSLSHYSYAHQYIHVAQPHLIMSDFFSEHQHESSHTMIVERASN